MLTFNFTHWYQADIAKGYYRMCCCLRFISEEQSCHQRVQRDPRMAHPHQITRQLHMSFYIQFPIWRRGLKRPINPSLFGNTIQGVNQEVPESAVSTEIANARSLLIFTSISSLVFEKQFVCTEQTSCHAESGNHYWIQQMMRMLYQPQTKNPWKNVKPEEIVKRTKRNPNILSIRHQIPNLHPVAMAYNKETVNRNHLNQHGH